MRSSDATYLSRLDHLRFVAATLVLFWHLYRFNGQVPTIEVPRFWPLSLFQEGHTGVALFLTMSGYLFWSKCRGREIKYWPFVRNRILRIAPLFVFWMLLYFYISDVDPIKLALAFVLLLNKAAVPGNGWTVIVEFQFYMLFPFLLKFVSQRGVGYLFSLLALAIFFRWSVWLSQGTVQNLAYSTIFGRIDQFLIGMLMSEFAARKPMLLRPWPVLCVSVICAIVALHWFDQKGGYFDAKSGYPSGSPLWIHWPTIEGAFYSFLIASYLCADFRIPAVLDRTLAKFGSYSYSMYLNQNFAIVTAYKLLAVAGFGTVGLSQVTMFGTVFVLPFLLLMSAATYYLIELPFLNLRHPYAWKIDSAAHGEIPFARRSGG